MSEDLLDSNASAPSGARPTFLTVLCVLTFIGSGLGVLGGLLGLVGASFLASFVPAAGGSVIWAILGLAASGLCLYGAIQMWNLKVKGFMMYVIGCGIAILVSILNVVMFSPAKVEGVSDEFAQASANLEGAVQSAMWTGVIVGIAINVAFILMYNANKKYMS